VASRRSVFGGLVQVKSPSPTKECNLYRQALPKGLGLSIGFGLESPGRDKTPQRRNHCIRQLQLSILGKALNALAVWIHFHGSGSIRFRDREFLSPLNRRRRR
jgi:hypothetical protein